MGDSCGNLRQHLHQLTSTSTHRGRTSQAAAAPQRPAAAAAAPSLHCWLARAAHCWPQVLAALQRCIAHTTGGDVRLTAAWHGLALPTRLQNRRLHPQHPRPRHHAETAASSHCSW